MLKDPVNSSYTDIVVVSEQIYAARKEYFIELYQACMLASTFIYVLTTILLVCQCTVDAVFG